MLPGKLTTAYIDHFFVGVGLSRGKKTEGEDFSPLKTTAISDRNENLTPIRSICKDKSHKNMDLHYPKAQNKFKGKKIVIFLALPGSFLSWFQWGVVFEDLRFNDSVREKRGSSMCDSDV